MANNFEGGDCRDADDLQLEPVPYKVGYKHPPVETRFQPGQSANPGGRPRRRQTFHECLLAELDRKTSFDEEGHYRRIKKRDAVVKRLVNGAIRGDPRCLDLLMKLLGKKETEGDGGDDGPGTFTLVIEGA